MLHAALVQSYRFALPPTSGPDQWWRLPSEEPYIWELLIEHLAGAGERDALAAIVTEPAYLARRIARGGSTAAEADLIFAARSLPDNSAVAWWRSWLARHENLFLATDDRAISEAQRLNEVVAVIRDVAGTDRGRPEQIRLDQLEALRS